ncbi:hypothetical protein T492DRAFT_204456 [Pavlovales sp. CCMP2436]|nr:hypothetical protein T492DRAFT_204456 [Pavlovales sp. CCMP2436]
MARLPPSTASTNAARLSSALRAAETRAALSASSLLPSSIIAHARPMSPTFGRALAPVATIELIGGGPTEVCVATPYPHPRYCRSGLDGCTRVCSRCTGAATQALVAKHPELEPYLDQSPLPLQAGAAACNCARDDAPLARPPLGPRRHWRRCWPAHKQPTDARGPRAAARSAVHGVHSRRPSPALGCELFTEQGRRSCSAGIAQPAGSRRGGFACCPR